MDRGDHHRTHHGFAERERQEAAGQSQAPRQGQGHH